MTGQFSCIKRGSRRLNRNHRAEPNGRRGKKPPDLCERPRTQWKNRAFPNTVKSNPPMRWVGRTLFSFSFCLTSQARTILSVFLCEQRSRRFHCTRPHEPPPPPSHNRLLSIRVDASRDFTCPATGESSSLLLDGGACRC